MIVDDEAMTKAVALYADDEGCAAVHLRLRRAENNSELVYRRLYRSANGGTVADKEAYAICHPEYQQAKEEEAMAYADVQGFKHAVNGADKMTDIWRSEYARTTAAERVR